PNLRPERSRETELGFDAGFFGERVGLEMTHYNKRTDDLLIAIPLPPSLGLTPTQFQNLGTVRNSGNEYVVTAKVLDLDRALFDHKGNYKLFNNTRRFRCSFGNCQEAYVPSAPLADQAASIGISLGTDAGYIEDASFTKLRELAFSVKAPDSFVSAFGGHNMELTVAGRNLHTWTKYTGFDPEINSTPGANFSTSDFLTLPPTRNWTIRLTTTF